MVNITGGAGLHTILLENNFDEFGLPLWYLQTLRTAVNV
jgi:hypothetical protein